MGLLMCMGPLAAFFPFCTCQDGLAQAGFGIPLCSVPAEEVSPAEEVCRGRSTLSERVNEREFWRRCLNEALVSRIFFP